MKKPIIQKVEEDSSIPWYKQITKAVKFPGNPKPEIFHSIKPQDYVTILAQTIERKIIIVKQYRPSLDNYTYELPSGHLEEGETPSQAIIRELWGETNCLFDKEKLILLGEAIPDTGRLENRLWAFYVNEVEINQIPEPDQNDGIEVNLISPKKLLDMINTGQFNHALDLSVISLAVLKRTSIFKFKEFK